MGILFFARFEGQKPWQHLRAMHDFGSLDAKRGPSRQDPYAMYPKPPDCTWKWTHRARILPFLSRKAYISGKYCQEEGLLRAFVEKRTHTVRFLPGDAVKQLQHEGWMRASWGSAAGVADAAEGCYRGGCCGDGSVRVTARRRTAYARCGRRTFAAMVHRRLNSGSNGGGRCGGGCRREWLP